MTTIQRPPLLSMLGRTLMLATAPPGSGPGHPGHVTPRGLWRSWVAGPASLALAATVPQAAAARHRAAGGSVTPVQGTGP